MINNEDKTSLIIFYPINNHYILINKRQPIGVLSKGDINSFTNGNNYSHTEIIEILNIEFEPGIYRFSNKGINPYFYKNRTALFLLPFIRSSSVNRAVLESEIQHFRVQQKEQLVSRVFAESSTIHSVASAIRDYTFSDYFSIWVTSEKNESLTCIASDLVDAGKLVPIESCPSLKVSLGLSTENRFESRDLSPHALIFKKLNESGMKYVNRITLPFGDAHVAVISYYSKFKDFGFNLKLKSIISQSIKAKLMEALDASHEKFEKFTNSLPQQREKESLEDYFEMFLDKLAECYDLKSTSLFLLNENQLELIKSTDGITATNEVKSNIYNHLDETYFAMYDENCLLDNENIKLSGVSDSLLIRRFDVGSLKYFLVISRTLDQQVSQSKIPYSDGAEIMLKVADFLSFEIQVRLSLIHIKRELFQATNFMKVWRHEIRSPISKFTLGADLIKRLLSKVTTDPGVLRKIEDQLDDIMLFGNRLKQLTDVYDFERIIDDPVFEKLSILKDLILPATTMTVGFAKKQYELDITVDHDSFRGVEICSDKKLLNMVLNALIDNALKYSSKGSKDIKIKGFFVNDEFNISIANMGRIIDDVDLKEIYKEGVRGSNASFQKIDGTGIGLYIAKRVIESLNGKLEQTSNTEESIEFTISIPSDKEIIHEKK